MSKKCNSCQKKFFLNLNRIKCMECDQGFCQTCIRKGMGIKFYCNICFILNTRPVDRSIIRDIRAKDVKSYLDRRNVRTDRCLEKEDLVNVFVLYVSKKEPSMSNNRSKMKNNLINGLISAFTSSMPNLSEQNNIPARSENTQREQPSSSQRVPPHFTTNSPSPTSPTESSSGPPPQSPVNNSQGTPSANNTNNTTFNTSSNTTSNTSSNTNRSEENVPPPQAPPPVRKLIKLSDIANVEDIPNLSVKQLKELLFINRIDFKGCVEKEELVKKAINLWIENKSEEDSENLPGEDLCKICMDAPLNSVLLECGHIATCIDCGKQLAECPICRQYIVRVVHTFKA